MAQVSVADVLDLEIHAQERMAVDDNDEAKLLKLKENTRKKKGRGFTSGVSASEHLKNYETVLGSGEEVGEDVVAQRSVDGWILFVTGIHEEAMETDVEGLFAEFGQIKSLHLNLDRRTGFLKGYAMIEYDQYKEAVAAKASLDGNQFLGNSIHVEWAFLKNRIQRSDKTLTA